MAPTRFVLLLTLIWTVTVRDAFARITDVVLFGDSYTDQSRSHSISNGTYPGKDYQEIYPPADTAADGGFQWPFYLGLYGNYTIWNYAVGGAVCSNELTSLLGVPDVTSGQRAWFVEDHVAHNGTRDQKLLLDRASFVVVFIGTNDIGINNFVTNDQRLNVFLPDVADCQLDTLRALHAPANARPARLLRTAGRGHGEASDARERPGRVIVADRDFGPPRATPLHWRHLFARAIAPPSP